MRSNYEWFYERATTTWSVMPGRSFLLIVPHGCEELEISRAVVKCVQNSFRTPRGRENLRPLVVAAATDNAQSSAQFVKSAAGSLCDIEEDAGAPNDLLEDLVAAVQDAGFFPVVVIERFHAFARIADDYLFSVLSLLRRLEHDREITTIAISPLTYGDIRKQLTAVGEFPFIHSAYGDNPGEIVAAPISRPEFVAAAASGGFKQLLRTGYSSSVADRIVFLRLCST
jgi:hypothetical protein